MVSRMVQVLQGLFRSALTTESPSPASATMMMKMMARVVAMPPTGPISSAAIRASDRPLRRTEAARITISCTAPPIAAPMRIQRKPGR